MQSIMLRPQFQIVEKDQFTVSIIGDAKIFDIKVDDIKVKEGLYRIQKGITASKLGESLLEESFRALVKTCYQKGLLREYYDNDYNNTPFEKHIDYFASITENPNKLQDDLKGKTILSIGVGGVGAIVLEHMAALGIENYHLVDYDKVQASNLNRQFLFDYNDIGRSKLEVTAKKIKAKLPEAKIKNYIKKISDASDVNEIFKGNNIDFIVCAADVPVFKIRMILLEVAKTYDVPIIFCGVGRESGSFGPFVNDFDKKNAYYKSLEKSLMFFGKNKCTPINMSIGYTNTLITTLATMDITRYFLGQIPHSLNKRISFNFETLQTEVLERF